MCFSKDVPEGPESSQTCDMMGKATGELWDGEWLYRVWVVAGGPVHSSILFPVLFDLTLLGLVERQEIIIKLCLTGWALLITHECCSRNTHLKMAVSCLLH